jgi:integrase
VLLAEVFSRYYSQHGENLRSFKRARYSLELWLEFYGEAAVGDLHDVAKQEAFHEWLREKDQSPGSMKRILAVGRAAINRAWKRGEIVSVPFIQMVESKNVPPMGRPLDVDEIAALVNAAPFHLQDFIFWMVGTGARPDAILELTWEQVDRENRIIHLNPPSRAQTKKYRPAVRLPKNFLPAVSHSVLTGPVILYEGRNVAAIRTSWRRTRTRAGLDSQVQPYSLRHTVARWLRANSVPVWEVAAQLGHSIQTHTITERYAPYDPAYLKASTEAIDRLLDDLRSKCVSVANDEKQLSL